MRITDGDKSVIVQCLKFCAVMADQKAKQLDREFKALEATQQAKFSQECGRLANLFDVPRHSHFTLADADQPIILAAVRAVAMLHEQMAQRAQTAGQLAAAQKSAALSGECVRISEMLEKRH